MKSILFFLSFLYTSQAFGDIPLSTWVGTWVGEATLYDLPQAPGETHCDVVATFTWVKEEEDTIEGTPIYSCERNLVFKPYHKFKLNKDNQIEMTVNWGWGNMDFTTESHGPWLSFFWRNHLQNPVQLLQSLVIRQMSITQFHTPGHLHKIITVKLPGRPVRYLLEGYYKKVSSPDL